jgi:hypothetical protein
MEDYFTLRIKPHDDGSCSLTLDPIIHANHWRPDSPPPDDKEIEVINLLRDRLDALAISTGPDKDKTQINVQAFSYALSPRLRRDYAVQKSSHSAATGNWLGAKLGLASRDSFTGETSEADIVGYVPPAPPPPSGGPVGLAARFGWVVAPNRQGPEPWQRGLSVQQAELGALVAVPSWWRTVLLRICTGFLKESDLPSITEVPLKDCRIDILRLPGTAQDVPRRLGVEVVKFPYIATPKPWLDTTLVAGRPGKLLLEGGRLWRSTVVMLGTQRADRIEVLPDMQGVSAFFSCVETPIVRWNRDSTDTQMSKSPMTLVPGQVEVPVRVWTSEGSTTPTFKVNVQVPRHTETVQVAQETEKVQVAQDTARVCPSEVPASDKGTVTTSK